MSSTASRLLALAVIGSCTEPKETATFNAYFYYPDNREEYLGQLRGLSACQMAAGSRASALGIERAHWGYICCLKTSKSECAEKHK